MATGKPGPGDSRHRLGACADCPVLQRAAPVALERRRRHWHTGPSKIIFSPAVWFGFSLLGLCIVLWVVGGLVGRRSAAAKGKPTTEGPGQQPVRCRPRRRRQGQGATHRRSTTRWPRSRRCSSPAASSDPVVDQPRMVESVGRSGPPRAKRRWRARSSVTAAVASGPSHCLDAHQHPPVGSRSASNWPTVSGFEQQLSPGIPAVAE